jgi:hypothetical protein
VRDVRGTVKDGKVAWLAKDVRLVKGGAGGDIIGTIARDASGERIDITWSGPGTAGGVFTLRRKPDTKDGFVSIFNGKDLTGWKVRPGAPQNWAVKDGVLTGRGKGPNHLFTEKADYQDVHVRAEVRINEGGNSGLIVRAPFIDVWPHGFEAQVNATTDDVKTGGLYLKGLRTVHPSEPPPPAGEWFTLEVVARRGTVTVLVNGKKTAEAPDPAPGKGHIALQLFGDKTTAEFRRIEVKELNPDDGFVSLFNGKDLTGWVNVNADPNTFVAKNGEIVTTGTPNGFLRTEKQYENFELELDWMHVEKVKPANSGLFIWCDPLPADGKPFPRGIEAQILINFVAEGGWATSHGDLFANYGARCKPDRPHPKGLDRSLPTEERVKGAGEWNHYKVVARNGAIKLHVNGKEVSGVSECTPRKGYIALQSEGSECHFKNIRIKELPSTDAGFVPLFNGKDLTGWKVVGEAKWSWADGRLLGSPAPARGAGYLVTEKGYEDFELKLEYRLAKGAGSGLFLRADPNGAASGGGHLEVQIADDEAFKLQPIVATGSVYNTFPRKVAPPIRQEGWNSLRVKLKGRRIEVWVNDTQTIDADLDQAGAKLATVPGLTRKSGGIGLQQNQQSDVEFRNVLIHDLKPTK